jgi:alpha-1,2-mannosyltransferase
VISSASPHRPKTRELTPEQHSRIRWQIVLLPVYVWLVYGWAKILEQVPNLEPIRDFMHFYVQGAVAREHNAAALYDMAAMAKMVPRLVPIAHESTYPPVYGPQVSVFFLPFAWLSYHAARNLWVVISCVVYALCCFAIWRVCPRLHDRPWRTAVLLVAAPGLHYMLGFVQISALALACFSAAFLALRANRPFLAGLAIGSLAYKPPLGIAAAVVFVAAGEWRVVAGAAVASAAQLAIGGAYWGPSILGAYGHALLRIPEVAYGMEPNRFHMHSWRAFFDLFQLTPRVALAAYAVTALGTLVVAVACWRSRAPLVLRYAVLLLATVLVDPHLYAYDLVVLIPVFMLLWDWSIQQGDTSSTRRFQWLLYACYFSPLFVAAAEVWRIQPSVLLMSALAVVVWMEASRREAIGITPPPWDTR